MYRFHSSMELYQRTSPSSRTLPTVTATPPEMVNGILYSNRASGSRKATAGKPVPNALVALS